MASVQDSTASQAQPVATSGDAGDGGAQFSAAVKAAQTTAPQNSGASGGTPTDQGAAAAPNQSHSADFVASLRVFALKTDPFDRFGVPPAEPHPDASALGTVRGSVSANLARNVTGTVYGQGTTEYFPHDKEAQNAVLGFGGLVKRETNGTTATAFYEHDLVYHGNFGKFNFAYDDVGGSVAHAFPNKTKDLTATLSLTLFRRFADPASQNIVAGNGAIEVKKSWPNGWSGTVSGKLNTSSYPRGPNTSRFDKTVNPSVALEHKGKNVDVTFGGEYFLRDSNQSGRDYKSANAFVQVSFHKQHRF